MARPKFDDVIEAVRYSKDMKIDQVRLYEKRYKAFSDLVILDRAGLVERLKKGKTIVTGHRRTYWGNNFDIDRRVLLRNSRTEIISSEDLAGEREYLTGVPVF